MVHYHDPVVLLQDICAYTFVAEYMISQNQLTSLTVAVSKMKIWHGCGWTLPVCLARWALGSHNISGNKNSVLISSWEFVITLDYEWSIRRHPPLH